MPKAIVTLYRLISRMGKLSRTRRSGMSLTVVAGALAATTLAGFLYADIQVRSRRAEQETKLKGSVQQTVDSLTHAMQISQNCLAMVPQMAGASVSPAAANSVTVNDVNDSQNRDWLSVNAQLPSNDPGLLFSSVQVTRPALVDGARGIELVDDGTGVFRAAFEVEMNLIAAKDQSLASRLGSQLPVAARSRLKVFSLQTFAADADRSAIANQALNIAGCYNSAAVAACSAIGGTYSIGGISGPVGGPYSSPAIARCSKSEPRLPTNLVQYQCPRDDGGFNQVDFNVLYDLLTKNTDLFRGAIGAGMMLDPGTMLVTGVVSEMLFGSGSFKDRWGRLDDMYKNSINILFGCGSCYNGTPCSSQFQINQSGCYLKGYERATFSWRRGVSCGGCNSQRVACAPVGRIWGRAE